MGWARARGFWHEGPERWNIDENFNPNLQEIYLIEYIFA